jgi:hypothetical protein
MENKKDIGSLLKERLTMLDRSPSASVWEGIEKDLNEKKKKRRFFIWLFMAAIVGSSFITYTFIHFNNTNSNQENLGIPSKTNSDDAVTEYNSNSQNNSENNVNSSTNSIQNETKMVNNTNSKSKMSNSASSMIVSSEKNHSLISRNTNVKNKNSNKNSIVFNSKKAKQEKKLNSRKSTSDEINNAISNQNPLANNSEKTAVETESSHQSIPDEILNPTLIDSAKIKKNTVPRKEKSLTETKKDSVPELEEDKNFSIIVAPYYGLTYSGKFGNGNSLSDQNTITNEGGRISQNFGILARWMGTEQFGIQTGVGMIQSNQFKEVENNNSLFYNSYNLNTENPMQSYAAQFSNNNTVTFYEEISYIEVPLEAYYIISKNKFGMATSFGFSLLFLNKNDVYLESDSVTKFRVGSLNNVVQQSISANAKLNLFYTVSKKMQLDVYPEFQFQVKGYKNVSNLNPYYLSLKAGISYKF